MKTPKLSLPGRTALTGICLSIAMCLASLSFFAFAQTDGNKTTESVSPAVAKPLVEAQELLKSKNFQGALAKIREVDSMPNKSPYEVYVADRMRGSAAAGAGESELAAKSFEAAIESRRMTPADQLDLVEAIVGIHYRAKDYVKASQWGQRYVAEGGGNAQIRAVLVQSQYLTGDFAGAVKGIKAEVAADDGAGQVTPEIRLRMLANCYVKLGDFGAYSETLERLVTHYPNRDYWADLIARLQKKAGFADRLGLDVYRLLLATGNLIDASDYMVMAELAVQAGMPAEAKKIIDDGYAKSVLGSGQDTARQKRLRDLVYKQAADDQKGLSKNEVEASAAKDGNAMVNLGYAYITLGQHDKGIALMERGIAKGGLKRAEDAKLHLGLAYLQSGKKEQGLNAMKSVQGSDGVSDLARLWSIHSK